MNKYAMLCGLFIAVFSQGAIAAQVSEPYIFDVNRATLGVGVMYLQFFSSDDFREGGSYGIPKDRDEIKNAYGFDVNAELLLNKTFSIKNTFGLAAGYRLEYMTRKYQYSFATGGTLDRKVNITNHILYCSASHPLGNYKYCFIGILAGLGLSKYNMVIDYSNVPTVSDSNKSSWGQVLPVGAFIDWGSTGIGARLGAELILSHYSKADRVKPSSTGGRLYFNVRYALF